MQIGNGAGEGRRVGSRRVVTADLRFAGAAGITDEPNGQCISAVTDRVGHSCPVLTGGANGVGALVFAVGKFLTMVPLGLNSAIPYVGVVEALPPV